MVNTYYKLSISSRKPFIIVSKFDNISKKQNSSILTLKSTNREGKTFTKRPSKSDILKVQTLLVNNIQRDSAMLSYFIWCTEEQLEEAEQLLRTKLFNRFRELRKGYIKLEADLINNHNFHIFN